MIDVQRVDYIRVPVTDMEQAKHFYGEVLGLERNPNLPHDDWVEYETGNVTLAVMTPHTHDYEFTPLPPGTIAFRVPDVAEARAIDLTGAWASQADLCSQVFTRKDNTVVYAEFSELFGSGFIIDGDRIRGKTGTCTIKSRKQEGNNLELSAACA